MSERPDLKVVPLPAPTDDTPMIVALLEATLERARAGDLESVVVTAVMRCGGMLSARHAPPESDRYALLGGLDYEAHLLRRLIDDASERDTLFTPPGAA